MDELTTRELELTTRRLELVKIAQARAKELSTELVNLLMEIMTENAEHGTSVCAFRFSKNCCRYGAWRNGNIMESAINFLSKSGCTIAWQEDMILAVGIAIFTIKDNGTWTKKSGRLCKYSELALITTLNDDDSSSDSE